MADCDPVRIKRAAQQILTNLRAEFGADVVSGILALATAVAGLGVGIEESGGKPREEFAERFAGHVRMILTGMPRRGSS